MLWLNLILSITDTSEIAGMEIFNEKQRSKTVENIFITDALRHSLSHCQSW